MGKSLIMESFTEKALNRNPILDSMRIQKQQGQMNSSFEKRRGSKRGERKGKFIAFFHGYFEVKSG